MNHFTLSRTYNLRNLLVFHLRDLRETNVAYLFE
jgi:hypothetical protein